MSIFQQGRELGYTPAQVNAMINEQRLYHEVLTCATIEDIKILLMHWIEQGKIR